jgi:flagellin
MPTVINTNLASLYAQNNLSNAQNSLANSVMRLSSGLRINGAKDDAAGLAISQSMQTQINGVNQSRRNLNDATNLIQVADTSLGTIHDMLLRMKTLTTQGYDGSLSASQRTQIVDEINELNTEINATAARTKFNKNNLIAATASAAFSTGTNVLTAGAVFGTVTSINANTSLFGTFTLNSQSTTLLAINGVIASTYGGVTTSSTYAQTLTMTGYAAFASGIQTINFDQVGISLDLSLRNDVVGTTNAGNATDVATALNTKVITISANAPADLVFQGGADTSTPNMITFDAINIRTDSTAGGLQAMNNLGGQVNLINSFTNTTAQTAWATAFSTLGTFVDAAVDLVSEQRSVMGALQNRISYINQNLEAYSTNLQSSRSAIMDADFAAETAKLTKGQILQQAATAMLAQANQMPNIVLSLLK